MSIVKAGAMFLGVVALAACAPSRPPITPITYKEYISRWATKSEAQVVVAWGTPDSSHTSADGGRVLEYRQTEAGAVVCITRFTIDNIGRVVGSWYRGDKCRPPTV